MLKKQSVTYLIQAALFIATLITTTISGAQHMNLHGAAYLLNGTVNDVSFYLTGLYYSIPFLGILTIHEFGHYIAARLYGLKVSLPYYIPFWLPIDSLWIGTMGAVIRMKSPTISTKQFFDIGIAGPLAGYVAAIALITYGFLTLPPADSIYDIHPEYKTYTEQGLNYHDHAYTPSAFQEYFDLQKEHGHPQEVPLFSIGTNLTFLFFEHFIVSDKSRIPNSYELMHNPFLFAGFLALFFTSLNLLPIGQLDGGHVLYGLFGYKKHKMISPIIFTGFVFYAGLGIEYISPLKHQFDDLIIYIPIYIFFLYTLYGRIVEGKINALLIAVGIFTVQFFVGYVFPEIEGYSGWLVFSFILSRFLGVFHPPALIESELDTKRKILGWFALFVFVISFSPAPFQMVLITP